ncbi:signal peptidase I [Leifsonia sp. YIM 134122]|uniref:Signal peptidase I n=1 Tax=Leifsonia stereocauli TaxID=3134136 RepID=A0ABU9W556_9MICO
MTTMIDAPERQENAGKERGVFHYVGLGSSLGLLAVVIGLAIALIVVPKIAGATPMTVLTQSMEPSLPPGTLLVVRPVDPADVRMGDVITYQIRSGDPAVITHRVIGIQAASDGSYSFTTKGDNNDVADPTVIEPQVQGRLWYSVPLVGYVNAAVNGDARSWIVPMIAVALFCYAAFMIVSGIIVSMRRRRREMDAAEPEASADDAVINAVGAAGTHQESQRP